MKAKVKNMKVEHKLVKPILIVCLIGLLCLTPY